MKNQNRQYSDSQLSGFYAYHQTKECPACGNHQARVKESRKVFEGTRRRYHCSFCDHKYTTYEINSDAYDELRSLRSNMTQLKQMFEDFNSPSSKVCSVSVVEQVKGIPCFECVHMNSIGCSFELPEAQTEDARGCNLFEKVNSDNMLT